MPPVLAQVTYENIVIDQPEQWPIWIGPAQQSDSDDLCAPNGGCSICWPQSSVCLGKKSLYADILFKNITIISPAQSVGVTEDVCVQRHRARGERGAQKQRRALSGKLKAVNDEQQVRLLVRSACG